MLTIKQVVILTIVLCTVPLDAMKRPRPQKVEENDSNKKQALEAKPFDFFFLDQQQILPFKKIIHESQTIIRTISTHKSQTIKKTISTFDSLSLTSKSFNEHFNKKPVMLDIIKEISANFNQSHQYVAQTFSIKSANDIYDTQELLYAYMHGAQKDPRFVIQQLDDLANNMNIIVNYTYCRNQQTALAAVLKDAPKGVAKVKIVDWLLAHGAIIAPITKDNDSAASIALYRNDFQLLEKFLFHKDFNPNYIGKNGNTLLHDCLIVLQGKKDSAHYQATYLKKAIAIIPIIRFLLNRNIDLSIVNNMGKTPHMIAKRLADLRITELLENKKSPQL